MVMQLFLSVSQVINFSPKTIAVFIGVVGILSILAQVFNWGNILDSALLLVSLSRRGVSESGSRKRFLIELNSFKSSAVNVMKYRQGCNEQIAWC